MNVVKAHLRTTIETLLSFGASYREIKRRTGVDRRTIRRYALAAKSPGVATGSAGIPGLLLHPGHRLCRGNRRRRCPQQYSRDPRRASRTAHGSRRSSCWDATP